MSAPAILLRSAARRLEEAGLLALSSACSVMALSVFAAAGSSPRFASLLSATDTARKLFVAASVAMAFFVGMSGWLYAEHYLRRRERELGCWLMLGMARSRAVLAISAEFAAASLVAFVAGLGLGAVFARFFGLVLEALMRDRSPIPLRLGLPSIALSAAACAAQWLTSTARAARELRLSTLTGLLRADRMAERAPRGSRRRAVLGCALVAAGYACAASCRGAGASRLMLPVLAAVVAGTFLAFDALVPRLIGLLRARQPRRGAAALVAAAQLSFRARRNSRLMAFTAVLAAMAASALGSMLALDLRGGDAAARACPHDLELSASTLEAVRGVEAALAAAGAVGTRRLDLEWLPCELSAEDWAGGKPMPVELFSASGWCSALEAVASLSRQVAEGRLVSCLEGRDFSRSGEGGYLTLSAGGISQRVQAYPGAERPPLSAATALSPVVVDDETYARLVAAAAARGCAPRRSSCWDGLPIVALRDAGPALAAGFGAGIVSRPVVLEGLAGLYGAMLFIGAFLSASFAIAAASLLAFRTIEDSRDDADRYRAIAGLGAERADLRRALALQAAFSFGLPLATGLLHAAFALAMMHNLTGYSSVGPTLAVSIFLAAAFAIAAALAVRRQEASIFADGRMG